MMKKFWPGVILAGIAACSLSVHAREQLLCAPDVCLMVGTGTGKYSFFGSEGELLLQSGINHDMENGISRADLDSVFVKDTEEDVTVFSPMYPEKEAVFPKELYDVAVGDSVYLVTSKQTGRCALYDAEGSALFETDQKTAVSDSSLDRSVFMEMPDGYLLKKAGDDGRLVWIGNDGDSYDIMNRTLLDAMDQQNAYPFGSNIVLENTYGEQNGMVISLQGEVIMEDIVRVFRDYGQKCLYSERVIPFDRLYHGERIKALYIIRKTDNGYALYDSSLNLCGEARPGLSADDLISVQAYEGCCEGFSCPLLEGRVCDGFIRDAWENPCPYSAENDSYTVYSKKEGLFKIRVPEGERLQKFNDGYYKTVPTDLDGKNPFCGNVYLRDSGERMMHIDADDPLNTRADLGSDGLLVRKLEREPDTGTGWPGYTHVIRDFSGNITFQMDGGYIRSLESGGWEVRRGVYHGVTDCDGKWKIRTASYWEE